MPLVRLCSRLLYDYLLREGVRIHEYCQRPLHGKVAVIDDDWSTIGSSNLDPLSLSLNLEANLVIHDVAFNGQLYQHLRELARRHCRRISRRHRARLLVAGAADLPRLPLFPAFPGHRRLGTRRSAAPEIAGAASVAALAGTPGPAGNP